MINMRNNLDIVGEISGTLDGMQTVSMHPDYMDTLIRDAHEIATDAFDEFAATYGLTGGISHMFEYGTAGVTDGPPRLNPMDEEARLWVHRLEREGNGGHEVSFVFRPAVMANPQPTTGRTGVPNRYITNLSKRKYVFSQKAFITETGTEVKIQSNRGQGLVFVPFYGKPSRGKYANNRGYMMWNSKKLGPVKANPGQYAAGNFTRVWAGWWSTFGGELMENEIYATYNKDFGEVLKAAQARAAAHPVIPPSPTSVHTVAKAAAAKTRTAMHRRSTWRDVFRRKKNR